MVKLEITVLETIEAYHYWLIIIIHLMEIQQLAKHQVALLIQI